MSANLPAARSAYDAAFASLIGCKGLLTEPLTERKLALLRERLTSAGDSLAATFLLLDKTDAEPPFIPLAPAKADSSNVVPMTERRSRRKPRS